MNKLRGETIITGQIVKEKRNTLCDGGKAKMRLWTHTQIEQEI